ncbi:MAG: putative ATPase [Gammaproteobacteria bacterium]|jgi:predicted AAA+ superfamily ATPase|nr:putative ATPase [Gammaproteobacteria bacterium]
MQDRFLLYNAHHYAPENYWDTDVHLKSLQSQVYLYNHPLIQTLPRKIPGIYTVEGGRQIGKTTLLKQWIALLLAEGVSPLSIVFFTGELIPDYISLIDLIQKFTSQRAPEDFSYIIIDEITYVAEWDRGIKFCADAGLLQNCIVVLTGSDLTLMQAAKMTFPGRRGKADKVDFHVYPLSFKAFLQLKKSIPSIKDILVEEIIPDTPIMQAIYAEFTQYLMHGGYLTAINDVARGGCITSATLQTYSDWIRGDMLKRGKQETYLKEILQAIIKRYNSQLSWHALAKDLSIDSHKTVADYCELLATMDALFIQSALLQDKLVAAPKKARKISFTDPFIYHAIKQWLFPSNDVSRQISDDIADPHIGASLVESIVSNQFRRYYPTYYLKGDVEIDVAYVDQQKFWPIEVKWRNQLRPSDVKALSKYPNVKVFARIFALTSIENIPLLPLPLALLWADKDS